MPSEHGQKVERRAWEESHPTALCRNDVCPWKYVGVDLYVTQHRADLHVSESGHAVRVYRQLHRDIEVEATDHA